MSFLVQKLNTDDDKITIEKYVILTLTDASNFSVGGSISTDAVGAGIGTISAKNGNVVTILVSSGDFANGNDVDNANPFVAAETAIVTVDNYYYDVLIENINQNINTMIAYLDYTKDTADLTIQEYFKDEYNGSLYYPLCVKNASGVISATPHYINGGTGQYRIPTNQSKNEEYLKWRITPSVSTGSDVLNIGFGENTLGA